MSMLSDDEAIELRTPTRAENNTPITPTKNDQNSTKTIYFIRHGESLGQRVKQNTRRTDMKLQDCGLSNTGIIQASEIVDRLQDKMNEIELVVSSPLTRALQTSLIAFPDKPILIDYNLREIGSMVPENIPRSMKVVLSDLGANHLIDQIDYTSLQPDNWPRNHNQAPNVLRKDQIRQSMKYLAINRPERTIAVVCHYHVIRSALHNNPSMATPTKKMNLSASKNKANRTPQQQQSHIFSSPQPTTSYSSSQETPSTPYHHNVEIHPKNAIPIQCQLDLLTYQLVLVSTHE